MIGPFWKTVCSRDRNETIMALVVGDPRFDSLENAPNVQIQPDVCTKLALNCPGEI